MRRDTFFKGVRWHMVFFLSCALYRVSLCVVMRFVVGTHFVFLFSCVLTCVLIFSSALVRILFFRCALACILLLPSFLVLVRFASVDVRWTQVTTGQLLDMTKEPGIL